MTRDEVIRLAREAGIKNDCDGVWCTADQLERFAALVAAAERNKLAAWMIRQRFSTGHGDTTEDLLSELEVELQDRIKLEREACAKLLERDDSMRWAGAAGAIRARSKE